jgi:exosortase A-associated hydrolase 2
MPHRLAPRFIDGVSGRIHVTEWLPAQPAAGRPMVLLLPPFAEEMNRSRRMFAEQARALATLGIGAATFDPYGTGDSEGEFGEARWEGWQQDLQSLIADVRSRAPCRLGMIALRSGALLALDAFRRAPGQFAHATFWAPVIDGGSIVRQLVRLHAAMFMNAARLERDKRPLEERLAAGESLEISGYLITPALVTALKQLELGKLGDLQPPTIDWFEVVAARGQAPPPASSRCVERLAARGVQIRLHTVHDQPFWSLPEITVAPLLVARTAEAIAQGPLARAQ